MDLKTLRSSIRKSGFLRDEECSVSGTPRLKRRISFSGRHLVREFRREEEPKAWQNSYEICDSAHIEDKENRPRTVFTTGATIRNERFTMFDDTSNALLLYNTRDLINTTYPHSELLLENSVDVTLFEKERNCREPLLLKEDFCVNVIAPQVGSFSFEDNEACLFTNVNPIKQTENTAEFNCELGSSFKHAGSIDMKFDSKLSGAEKLHIHYGTEIEPKKIHKPYLQKRLLRTTKKNLLQAEFIKDKIFSSSSSQAATVTENHTSEALHNTISPLVSTNQKSYDEPSVSSKTNLTVNLSCEIDITEYTSSSDTTSYNRKIANEPHDKTAPILENCNDIRDFNFRGKNEYETHVPEQLSEEIQDNSLNFSLSSGKNTLLSPDSFSHMIPTKYKMCNFKQLNDDIERGKIQLYPKTPSTDRKSKQNICSTREFSENQKERRTLFLEEDILITPVSKKCSKSLYTDGYFDLNSSCNDDTNKLIHPKCRFSQAEDLVLNSTSFIIREQHVDDAYHMSTNSNLTYPGVMEFSKDVTLSKETVGYLNIKKRNTNNDAGSCNKIKCYEKQIEEAIEKHECQNTIILNEDILLSDAEIEELTLTDKLRDLTTHITPHSYEETRISLTFDNESLDESDKFKHTPHLDNSETLSRSKIGVVSSKIYSTGKKREDIINQYNNSMLNQDQNVDYRNDHLGKLKFKVDVKDSLTDTVHFQGNAYIANLNDESGNIEIDDKDKVNFNSVIDDYVSKSSQSPKSNWPIQKHPFKMLATIEISQTNEEPNLIQDISQSDTAICLEAKHSNSDGDERISNNKIKRRTQYFNKEIVRTNLFQHQCEQLQNLLLIPTNMFENEAQILPSESKHKQPDITKEKFCQNEAVLSSTSSLMVETKPYYANENSNLGSKTSKDRTFQTCISATTVENNCKNYLSHDDPTITPRKSIIQFLNHQKPTTKNGLLFEDSINVCSKKSIKRLPLNITPISSVSKKQHTSSTKTDKFLVTDIVKCNRSKNIANERIHSLTNDEELLNITPPIQISCTTPNSSGSKEGHHFKKIIEITDTPNSTSINEDDESISESIQEIRKNTTLRVPNTTICPNERLNSPWPMASTYPLLFECNPINISDAYLHDKEKSIFENCDITNPFAVDRKKCNELMIPTRFSSVKTLPDEYLECALHQLKVDVRTDDSESLKIDDHKDKQASISCIAERNEYVKSSQTSKQFQKVPLLCVNCTRCKIQGINENISSSQTSFLLPPSLTPTLTLNITRLRNLRSRLYNVDINVFWKRSRLNHTIKPLNNFSGDDLSFSDNTDADCTEEIHIIRQYKTYFQSFLTKAIKSKTSESSITKSSTIAQRHFNWIIDSHFQYTACLQYFHRKMLTFSLVITFQKLAVAESELNIKSVNYTRNCATKINIEPIDFILDFQLKLSRHHDMLILCEQNSQSDIPEILNCIDEVCIETILITVQLQRIVLHHGSSIIRDDNRTFVRKIVRKLVSLPRKRKQIEEMEFRIELLNIKKLSYKDIATPPLFNFNENIHLLPVGLSFLKKFLRHPLDYLKPVYFNDAI